MAKGKAHERGLARARARRARRRRRTRRRRWTGGVLVGLAVLAIVALVVTTLPSEAPSPVVDDTIGPAPSTPAASPTVDGPTAVACGGQVPAASQQDKPTFNEPPTVDLDAASHRYRATMTTSCGDIVIELFADRAPRTVENFLALARMDYYAGVTFHRVIQGFMIQGGDPTATGAGDPGYTIEGELGAARQEGYRRGIVAMANKGGDPNTASTQFFIVQGEDVDLSPDYAVFGEVVQGMDVVDLIAAVPTGIVDGRPDVPSETVYIEDVTVEELPADGDPTPDEEASP